MNNLESRLQPVDACRGYGLLPGKSDPAEAGTPVQSGFNFQGSSVHLYGQCVFTVQLLSFFHTIAI